MVSDPQKRSTEVQVREKSLNSLTFKLHKYNPHEYHFLYRDLQRDDYVIESMHNIDSNQIKYPSERDTKWTRNGILFILI